MNLVTNNLLLIWFFLRLLRNKLFSPSVIWTQQVSSKVIANSSTKRLLHIQNHLCMLNEVKWHSNAWLLMEITEFPSKISKKEKSRRERLWNPKITKISLPKLWSKNIIVPIWWNDSHVICRAIPRNKSDVKSKPTSSH